jgi:hypothetical protein
VSDHWLSYGVQLTCVDNQAALDLKRRPAAVIDV